MTPEPTITPEIIAAHGLTPQEYQTILTILGRPPRIVELGIFSAMWSEHCSYKNSKPLLRTLPTEGPCVLQGPGENAGVIAFEGDTAIAFKMESHNHPSAVEPYEGAATGVGGILRDIFTMGARPVALLDCLRFGNVENPRTKRIIKGVISGIAGYGNAVGVPVVGGDTVFDPAYDGNPLVNVMCVGVLPKSRITLAAASGVGNLVVYYGNATGRDGIHGAAFSSVELTEESTSRRGAIQVGDPFMEKKILEATIELINAGVVVALQDMGAAGLTCSCAEMAGRGGLGVRIELDNVPQRAEKMSAYEMMLSESQERMLAIVEPSQLDAVRAILQRWDLDAHVLGELDDTGLFTVLHHGEVVAQLPAAQVSDQSPVYQREARRPQWMDTIPTAATAQLPPADADWATQILQILARPNVASKEWITERYDSMVQTQTQFGPGMGAAVLKLDGCEGRLALTGDCNGAWVMLDPYFGAQLAVAEAARNLACVGARPLAITNCLNFGSPLKPEGFYQLSEAVRGLGDACRALGTPVTGGNVSLYNETPEAAIHPTPMIGMVGRIEPGIRPIPVGLPAEESILLLIGPPADHLGGSEYLHARDGQWYGPCPTPDLQHEKALIEFLLAAAAENLLLAAQDLSTGGLAVTLCEMLYHARTPLSIQASLPGQQHPANQLFAETPGRVIVAVSPHTISTVNALIERHKLPATQLGSSKPASTADVEIQLLPTTIKLSLPKIQQALTTIPPDVA